MPLTHQCSASLVVAATGRESETGGMMKCMKTKPSKWRSRTKATGGRQCDGSLAQPFQRAAADRRRAACAAGAGLIGADARPHVADYRFTLRFSADVLPLFAT